MCVRVNVCLGFSQFDNFPPHFVCLSFFPFSFLLFAFFSLSSFAAFCHLVLHESMDGLFPKTRLTISSCPVRFDEFNLDVDFILVLLLLLRSRLNLSSSTGHILCVGLSFLCVWQIISIKFLLFHAIHACGGVKQWYIFKSKTKSIRSNPRTGHIKIQDNHLIGRILSTDCMSFFLSSRAQRKAEISMCSFVHFFAVAVATLRLAE